MTGELLTATVRERLSQPRWVYGNGNHWALSRGCPCCGNMGIGSNAGLHRPCEPAACLLCGSVQCNIDGRCKVCLFGWMPNWSRPERTCGYAKCDEPAVAVVPGKKRACLDHARAKVGDQVAARIAHRDSGQGWERWLLTGPRVPW